MVKLLSIAGAMLVAGLPALKGRGIDVPYIVKDNERHGFRNEENQFEFYDAMEKFLDKHIGKSAN